MPLLCWTPGPQLDAPEATARSSGIHRHLQDVRALLADGDEDEGLALALAFAGLRTALPTTAHWVPTLCDLQLRNVQGRPTANLALS
ncbi:hypothetical protein ACFRIB_19520 [Streptomyces mirabilis]|uniref:hypothetical protein n=1 Tax=Streptomyces mirabilis TaxID=68239 RepID=UPI0036CF78D8